MAEQSLLCFLRPRRRYLPPLDPPLDPPPLIARDTKYMSLWRSLSYFDQEKLQSLLKQLEPVGQYRLLSLLELLDQQGQESLIEVLDELGQSEQVQLFGILNEHEVLEQQVILKALNQLYGKSDPLWYQPLYDPFEDVPEAKTVLSLLKSLRPLDRLKLLRLLEGLDHARQCKLVSVLEGLDRSRQCELVSVLDGLDHIHRCELVSVLDGLDHTRQCELMSILEGLKQQEQQQLLIVLVGLDYSGQAELLEIIVQLKGQKKQQLLRVLDGLDSSLRQEILEVMVGLKLTGKGVLLRELDRLGSQKRAKVLKVIREYCEAGLLSSNAQSSLFESGFTILIPRLLERQKRLADELDRTLYLEAQLRTYLRAKLQAKLLELHFLCWLRTLSIDSGGSRNVLLDGWWLEFWEIILLAAGDVERNPGPTFMTEEKLAEISNALLEEDDLSGVFDEVRPVSSKWFQFCCCLGIPPSRLETIRSDHPGDSDGCLFEGLNQWLQRNYNTEKHGSPTWRRLVAAVDNSAGGNNHVLALAVAEKHKALSTVTLASQVAVRSRDDRRRSEEMSRVFRNMYRSVIQLLRRVDVREVKDSLCFLTVPGRCGELCVPPQVYEFAASTKDLLDHLCPKYINPENTFILEDIVANFGSRRCKRLFQEYMDKIF